MASPTQIAAKVAKGYAIAASHLGDTCNWYRPANVGPAIVLANLQGTLPASFSPDGTYLKPQQYGRATWIALVDTAQIRVGDYLVDPRNQTWFLAQANPDLPPLAVQCTRVLSFLRPTAPANFG